MIPKLLSVSIAAFNVGNYLERTIKSITEDNKAINQIEIIIVNDGSNDETLDIAHKMEAEYPESVVVIDKENGGYGSTINCSLAIARGKYYKLLDGDDWFNTESLGDFLHFLSVTESDLVITPYYEYAQNYILIDNHKEIPERKIALAKYECSNPLFAMHEMAIKTDVLRNLGKEIAEHCFYTDTEYAFYCFRSAHSIVRFTKPIYCYRLGLEGQSVSLSGTRKHYKDFMVVAERLCKAYEEMPENDRNEKMTIYKYTLMKYMYNTFKAFMILENPLKEKKTLREFDKRIKKKYSEAYKISGGSNLVKLLRVVDFNMYYSISRIVMKIHITEFS